MNLIPFKTRLVLLLSFLFEYSEGRHWGQGFGNMGGFHSGGRPGYGYGPDICAEARRRQQQQGLSGGGNSFPHQSSNPYAYNDNNQYGNYYYQNPSMVGGMPIGNNQLDYRINYQTTTTTPAPSRGCALTNARDVKVFQQKCLFPPEVVQTVCTSRGSVVPTGTTSFTTCKAPDYYNDAGDMILEICKDGKWHSDGKSLTCKAAVVVTPAPVVEVRTPAPVYQQPDNVVQYVQQPQQQVYQPVVTPAPPTYTQWTPEPVRSQPVMPVESPTTTYWQPAQQNYSGYPSYSSYPYYIPSTTTTSTTTEPTTTTTTTTTTTPPPTTTTTTTTPPPTTSTTTMKPWQPAMIDQIDWRNYANPNIPNYTPDEYPSSFYYRPSTEDSRSSTSSEKCPPLPSKNGVILECLSRVSKTGGSSGFIVSISDCQEPQAVGTEATYKCQMYYEPLNGAPTQYRKCKENGVWTGSDDGFGCNLECGKSNPGGRLPLITFGETTMLGQWPWHTALFIRDRGDLANSCGGTLVTRRAVITAAHCVTLHYSSLTRELSDVRVDLGRYYREKDDPYVQKMQVAAIIIHPAYNPFMFESDIAIIILKESAKIGFHVRPSCFPKTHNAAFDDMQLADGSMATVVGWGLDENEKAPDELRSAKIQVIGYRECIESFEDVEFGSQVAKSTTFCAGNRNGTNVCQGDSGGGAFFAVKTSTGSTRWYLQGIVSIGVNYKGQDRKCDPEKVSIFTRVSPYADWINRVISEHDAM